MIFMGGFVVLSFCAYYWILDGKLNGRKKWVQNPDQDQE